MEQGLSKRVNKANARQHRNHRGKYGTYRMLHRYERSHIRRIEKHIKRYKDSSPMVQKALEKYRAQICRGGSLSKAT